MKRIASLTLAALLGLSCASTASAVEIKVKGYYDFAFGLQENATAGVSGTGSFKGSNFYEKDGGDDSVARQRFRTQIDIIASEALKGVLFFEIGDQNWGRGGNTAGNGTGGSLSADGINIKTRRAYIDWFVPNTNLNFRIGIQGLALPGAVAGSPVFDDDVAAFVASYKFNDTFSLTAFWARPFDENENDGWDQQTNDEMDMFGLIAPITVKGAKITPWAVYAALGESAGYYGRATGGYNNINNAFSHGNNNRYVSGLNGVDQNFRTTTRGKGDAYWVGSAFEISILDPIIFKMDAIYGSLSVDDAWVTGDTVNNTTSYDNFKSSGWFIDAAIDYKASWGTPGIFGWYSSGDKLEDVVDGKLGRMPTFPGTTPNFKPGSFGFDGSQNDVMTDAVVTRTGIGYWGIGAQVKDLTFIENLKHTIRVLYYAGTNDQDIVTNYLGRVAPFGLANNDLYLGKNENVIEVNFDHKYNIYENLQLVVDLAYLRLNLDEERGYEGAGNTGQDWSDTKDAWKAQFGFRYSF